MSMDDIGAAGETLLTVKQVAKKLGLIRGTVYALIRSGELSALDLKRPGRTKRVLRIRPATLEAYLAAREEL